MICWIISLSWVPSDVLEFELITSKSLRSNSPRTNSTVNELSFELIFKVNVSLQISTKVALHVLWYFGGGALRHDDHDLVRVSGFGWFFTFVS